MLEAGEAQRFRIEVGQQLNDLVMTLRPTKAARVNGTILTSDGRPYSGMLNVMRTAANGMVTNNLAAMIRPDGTFQLNNLAPGDYQLRTFPNGAFGPPGSDAEMAMAKITVAGEDISDLQLVTSKPLSVSGRLIVDAAAAQSLPPGLFVNAFPFEGGPAGPSFNSPGRVADDFTFTLKTGAGRSRITLGNMPPGWSLRAIRFNGADVIDTGVELKPNENVRGLEIELTNKTSTVTGLATTGRGEASKDYTAVTFPEDTERWKLDSRLHPDRPAGSRRPIQDLRPAARRVLPRRRGQPRTRRGDGSEFLERVHTKATRFSLSEGETKSIPLKLNSSS